MTIADESILNKIRAPLLDWYSVHHRRLPWRETRDPYRIWVSEVMLQQTQAKTVAPYYVRFISAFPDAGELARADLDRVLKTWEGLGYYARARNLHRAARIVCEQHGGRIPDDPVAFRALPGVGDYICAAVQSIAFGAGLAVLDGNVRRVLARLFVIDVPVDRTFAQGTFREAADRLLDPGEPGTFNQAVMELGAVICRPAKPFCADCPLPPHCRAHQTSRQRDLPVRAGKAPPPTYHFAAAVVEEGGRLLLARRQPEGLLGGLWEFPGAKVENGETPEAACARGIRRSLGLIVDVEERIARVRHAYTHFKMEIDVFRCRHRGGAVVLDGPADYRWVAREELDGFALPRASHKILAHLRHRSR